MFSFLQFRSASVNNTRSLMISVFQECTYNWIEHFLLCKTISHQFTIYTFKIHRLFIREIICKIIHSRILFTKLSIHIFTVKRGVKLRLAPKSLPSCVASQIIHKLCLPHQDTFRSQAPATETNCKCWAISYFSTRLTLRQQSIEPQDTRKLSDSKVDF